MLQQKIRMTAGNSRERWIDRATGWYVQALKEGLAMLSAAIFRSYRRQVARRHAHLAALELSRFEDRMLNDIGLSRNDIPRVMRDLAERADSAGKRAQTAAPLRSTAPVGEPGFGTRLGQKAACC